MQVRGLGIFMLAAVLNPYTCPWPARNFPWARPWLAVTERSETSNRALPLLITLSTMPGQLYLYQARRYHRVPNLQLLHAMGYHLTQVAIASILPAPSGHPLTFFYKKSAAVGYWFHRGAFFPVKAYATEDWLKWGHVIQSVPFPVASRWVSLNRFGASVFVSDGEDSLTLAPKALRPYAYRGLWIDYPAAWTVTHAADGALYLRSLRSQHHFEVRVSLKPDDPAQFIPIRKAIALETTRTWGHRQGAGNEKLEDQTVDVFEAVSPYPGSPRRVQLSAVVPRTKRTWAFAFLRQWRISGNMFQIAHLEGSSNQHGSPILPVTVIGPTGAVNTWAELDTGNQSETLITQRIARAIGLHRTSEQINCGIDNCSLEPSYRGITLAPRGTVEWMESMAVASRWQGSGAVSIDLGTQFLKRAALSLADGRWQLSWPVANPTT